MAAIRDSDVGSGRGCESAEELGGLVESMGRVGQLQPIVVRELEGGGWELVAGRRRLRAARVLGWSRIPAVQLEVEAEGALGAMWAENWDRRQLSPLEEARLLGEAYARVQDVDVVAGRIGRTRRFVEERLALLELPDDVQGALEQAAITLGVARELGRVADDGARAWLLDSARNGGATVGTVARWVADYGHEGAVRPAGPPPREALAAVGDTSQVIGRNCRACGALCLADALVYAGVCLNCWPAVEAGMRALRGEEGC